MPSFNVSARLGALFATLFCVAMPLAASAQTPVSGAINVDTAWTVANSPYVLVDDVAVQAGSTLTIEPGVVVQGAGGTELIVRGALVASGGPQTPIVFRAQVGQTPGAWDGLRFEAGASATLQNVQIHHAETGLEFAQPDPANLVLDGVQLRTFRTRAVYAVGGTLTLQNFDIDGVDFASDDGIYGSGTVMNISGSRILNVDDGVFVDNGNLVLDHTVIAFATDAVDFRVTRSPSRTLTARYSTFYRNGDAVETYRGDSSYAAIINLDNSLFGMNTAVVRDAASRSYRASTFRSFNRNIWWGERLTSGQYAAAVPGNGSSSMRYRGLLVDPENGDFAPTDRSPARYWGPDTPALTAGAVPFAGAPTGGGVHGFWYANHTFAPRTVTEVAGDIVVARGYTLTFQPASELRFLDTDTMMGGLDRGRIELRVEGTLEADGTNSNPVTFTSANAAPQAGDWYGVVIVPETEAFNVAQVDLGYAVRGVSLIGNDHIVAGSSIHDCSLAGIWINGGTPSVEEVEIYDSQLGIDITGGASADLIDVKLHNNSSHGLRSYDASFTLEDSIVRDNTQNGVNISVATSRQTARIFHSTIAHNGRDGLAYQRSDSSFSLTLTLDSSSVTHNVRAGVVDSASRSYRRAPLRCVNSNVWGNADAFNGVIFAGANDCFAYNPLYADADARNYEPTVHSPNRALGTNRQHVGALPHVDAVGPLLMGYLWDDFTFTEAGSPWPILGDVVVPQGVTVNFEPGARLQIVPDADGMGGGLSVGRTEFRFLNGSINLFDGSGAPISFMPDSDAPRAGMWSGLRFENGGTSVVDNAVIGYAEEAIVLDGPTAPPISNSFLLHNAAGMRFEQVNQSPTVDVMATRVIGVGTGTGLSFNNASGRVRSSYITHHTFGVNVQSSRAPNLVVYLVNNTLVHHRSGIRYQRSDSSYRLAIHISNNVIAQNTAFAIEDAATRSYRYSQDYIRSNNLFGNDTRRGQPTADEGNIVTDPLIEDDDWDSKPRWWDGKLWAQSLAINAGNAGVAQVPATDLLGKPRNLAGGVDIGAFEFDPDANQEPRADAATASIMVPRGEVFSLDGSQTVDPDGQIASWFWTMSDGRVTAGRNIEHTFATAGGDQWAYITVIDNEGAEDHAKVSINVNIRPIADAGPAVFQDEGPAESVFFDGTLSSDPDGNVVRWSWDFGDGTPVSGEASPRHSYLSAGLYTVVLTVTDNEGLTHTDTTLATVFGANDIVGPLIEHVEIADGQPLNAAVVVTATIRDPSAVESAALFYRPMGGGAPGFAVMSKGNGDVWSATIPAAAVTAAGVEYWFTAIDGGQPDGNTSLSPANAPAGGVFDFLVVGDPNPPAIAHVQIADGQDPGVAVTVNATVTDATGISEVVLLFRTEGGVAFGATNMVRQGQTDVWSAQIPAFVVSSPGVDYFIQATDTSPIPNSGAAPAAAPAAVFNFVVGNPDRSAPVITHVPIADGQPAAAAVVIAASVTDNTQVTGVNVYYRQAGTQQFLISPLLKGDGNAWAGQIPAGAVVEGQLQYYIRAVDAVPNVATHPAGAPGSLNAFTIAPSDAAGPTIGHTAVVDGQPEGEAVVITATAQDPSGVAYVRIHYRPEGFPFYQEAPMVLAGGIYTGQIPGFAVAAPGVEYYVRAGDNEGNISHNPAGAPAVPNRFTVSSGADEIGPTITHTPIADGQPAGVDIVVTASVADVTGVASVSLYHRSGGGAFVELPLVDQGGNLWQIVLPGAAVQDPSVEYYLAATDTAPAANTSRMPAGVGTVSFTVRPAVPGPRLGDLVITEIMANPSAVSDTAGEWFELFVASAQEIELAGTVFTDAGGNRFVVEGSLRAQPGDYLVFGRNGDSGLNGGVTHDYVYGSAMSLSNGSDSIIITSQDGVLVDTLAYDAAWPATAGASIKLGAANPALPDNAISAEWCVSTSPIGQSGDLGTPGRANPECVVVDLCAPNPCDAPPPAACSGARVRQTFAAIGQCAAVDGQATCEYPAVDVPCGQGEVCQGGECVPGAVPVDFCRLQHPPTLDVETGTATMVFGRVFQAGITDRTAGVDVDPNLLAELGVGPDASAPADNAAWAWTVAEPNPAWDGAEPNNDEYQASLLAGAPGSYDYAFRFSVDGGTSWTYCDTGSGSTDGYAVADAGALISRAVVDPCAPNPCNAPPAAVCDGNTAVIRPVAGACVADGINAVCTYAEQRQACGNDICVDGACVPDPCAGDVCNAPPADACADDQTLLVYGAGECAVEEAQAVCAYPPVRQACAANQRCAAGACVVFVPGPVAGDLRVTEIMQNPSAVSDSVGEWFEVRSMANRDVQLRGVVFSDDRSNRFVMDTPRILPSGGYLVFARNGDVQANGGVVADVVYGDAMTLSNTADSIVITNADGVEVSRIGYSDAAGWPDVAGVSMQLDPAAADPSALEAWCSSRAAFGAGDLGSPGVANPPCRVAIDFCRLEAPLQAQADAGDSLSYTGRVLQAGITDRTPQVDVDPDLLAQLGYGAAGSAPGQAWTWRDAVPTPGWDGAGAGEPDQDEYRYDLTVPGLGSYDLAFRFSADGGQTWTVCDGGAGSTDGYAAVDAAHLVVAVQVDPCEPNPCQQPPATACDGDVAVAFPIVGACVANGDAPSCTYTETRTNCGAAGDRCEFGACVANPCEPNPCVMPPATDCADADTVRSYAAQGACRPDEDRAECLYAPTLTACGAGSVCAAGQCVGDVPGPMPGELVVTEILYDPRAVRDSDGEWFEVKNLTEHDIELAGTMISDEGANRFTIAADTTIIAPGQYFVFGRLSDRARNGGARVDYAYGGSMSLGNSDDEIIIHNSLGQLITRVSYARGGDWPNVTGISIQLDGALDLRVANVADGTSWCESERAFGGPGGDLGTPGEANRPCTAPPVPVGSCRLDHPLDVTVEAGARVEFFGRVMVPGITDRTPGIDFDPDVIGQLGIGPDGSRPQENMAWRWADAMPNPQWDGAIAGEPELDEHVADVTPQAAGLFDFAFRFSADGGRTWTYCDAENGSLDGYDPDNAGRLEVTAPEVVPGPQVGDLVVTEFIQNPDAVGDTAGEWFEIWNATPQILDLGGVEFSDDGANSFTVDDGTLIQPGQYFVLARNGSFADNGGVTADYVYGGGMSLSNGDDEIVITNRQGQEVDRVNFGRAGWVRGAGVSIQLDADFDARAIDNNASGAWCASVMPINPAAPGSDLGSPGRANEGCTDYCDPNPCDVAPNAFCDGNVAIGFPAVGACADVENEAICAYAEQPTDCGAAGQICLAGACVDDPCAPNPCDTPPEAACVDEVTRRSYPAVGVCTVDGGEASCDFVGADEACAGELRCVAGACVDAADRSGPQIVLEALPDSVAPGTAVVVRAEVTDASGIDEVVLSYSTGDDWIQMDMLFIEGDTYEATIPGEEVVEPELAIAVEATDGEGNISWAPEAGEDDPITIQVLAVELPDGGDVPDAGAPSDAGVEDMGQAPDGEVPDAGDVPDAGELADAGEDDSGRQLVDGGEIADLGGITGDTGAGSDGSPDAPTGGADDGCACDMTQDQSPSWLLLLLLVGVVRRRRR